MEVESRVTRSTIDELHSLGIEGDQMEGESGLTRSTIHELLSWDIQDVKWQVKAWYYWKYH